MDRLKEGMKVTDVSTGKKSQATDQVAGSIRENISEHVGCDNDVIPLRMHEHVKAEGVDIALSEGDQIFSGHADADIPEEDIGFEYIRLMTDGEVSTAARQPAGMTGYSLAPLPRQTAEGAG